MEILRYGGLHLGAPSDPPLLSLSVKVCGGIPLLCASSSCSSFSSSVWAPVCHCLRTLRFKPSLSSFLFPSFMFIFHPYCLLPLLLSLPPLHFSPTCNFTSSCLLLLLHVLFVTRTPAHPPISFLLLPASLIPVIVVYPAIILSWHKLIYLPQSGNNATDATKFFFIDSDF